MTARKYAAINIDGVLLTDTFSTVIYDFIVEHGGVYDEDTERAILSQPQSVGGAGMARATRRPWTSAEAIEKYFEKRSEYISRFPPEVIPGARELLQRLHAYDYSLIAYGGLSKDHFDAEVGDLAQLFGDPSTCARIRYDLVFARSATTYSTSATRIFWSSTTSRG